MDGEVSSPNPGGWGGVECTGNRVGDQFHDQLVRSGHAARLEDLDRFAQLGIRSLRYPVLWERTAPNGLADADWTWADQRLGRMRELGIRPIVGLVHHGSGPRDTNLLDPSFPFLLAEFAEAVAQRYPWLDAYTPVNEPLTTARFSGLYGFWYPHGRDYRTFARALVTQCRAIALAMEAFRRVNPRAELVQTEDLGRTYSSPALASLAAYYNERRWLSLDLLCGRVSPAHPLYQSLIEWGITPAELAWHVDHPWPPDIVGVNHYVSSDRYLDEVMDQSGGPTAFDTHEGRPFIDMEAVRACADCPIRVAGVLRDVWDRYRLPVAITET